MGGQTGGYKERSGGVRVRWGLGQVRSDARGSGGIGKKRICGRSRCPRGNSGGGERE